MKITSIIGITVILFSFTANLFPQQNDISPEERRARIVEAYNREMQLRDDNKKGGEDPLPEAMTERFFTGQAAGDNFGWSISTAGDVNADGYDDIIVGAYNNDAGGNNAGRAYLYFGGDPMDYIPDFIVTGDNPSDFLGTSVSTAGDVNGDGYCDIIIGANGNDNGATNGGVIYIYFGGETIQSTADVKIFGTTLNNYFGTDVATAGDVNGDGYSDVIVATYVNNSNTGIAYIYFGGPSMDTTPDVTMTGEAPDNFFGSSISSAGDVNGDGYSDVIVGAYGNDGFANNAGRAYIYFGGASMDNTPDIIMNGEAPDNFFGSSISSAGDVNGDGYTDVVVGAYFNSGGTGKAYIFLGGAAMNNTADVVMTGQTAGDIFGISVSSAGDINGDGYSDVIVGAYLNDAGGNNAGRAYVYYGGETMDNIKDVILTGEAADDRFGSAVALAGDVNGDGYDDIIVGAFGNDAGGTSAGRAYLYINSLTGLDIPDEIFTGGNLGDWLGNSVSDAGDVNGDGYDDFIVGVRFYNNGTNYSNGKANIYFGGPLMDTTVNVSLSGSPGLNFKFGGSVSSAGDVNGDGFDDVIVGAHGEEKAYIFFGGVSMDNAADVTLFGESYPVFSGNFGSSVSSAGDVNGDGYDDVIVGARNYYISYLNEPGRAYIYYGGQSMDNTADVIMTGEATYNSLGESVSGAGDLNGDGYDDVIIGAPDYNSGTTPQAGRAYIYFGSISMDNIADLVITGSMDLGYLGRSVSSAGDVNSDGYSDVVLIHPGAQFSAIYFGGPFMDNIADVTMEIDGYFYSVSDAGDVNGDGYSDVIVGIDGKSFVYFGGNMMDNTADVVMTGEYPNDSFGFSVSSAGDVNGDGLSDLIVGAPTAIANSQVGRAYLYISSSPPSQPRIVSVKDVPNDQGGYLFVNFLKSAWDQSYYSEILGYAIEMSAPPGTGSFNWIQIGTVLPLNYPNYSFLAHTLYDSSLSSNETFYFRVTAVTNQFGLLRSNIMYGHSVDNLAPLPPGAFYANLNGSNVHLGWQANLESDFRDYYIYRSDTPVLDDLTLLGTTTDTTFIDTSPLTGNAYYYISAYDIHDNASAFSSDSIMAFLSANIKVFLEGAYIGGQMSTFINTLGYIPLSQPFNTGPWNYTGTETVTTVPANITDWILVELRSTETTVVDRRAAFLKNDGTLVDLDGVSNIKFPTASAGDYYVVIIHRNHLAVMTATPVTISFSPTLYDMTDINNAYGTNAMKDLGGGFYGAYTADTDGTGTVNASDRSNTWNQRNLSGYYGTDVDLSGTVNAADRSVVWNNRNLSTQVPVSVDSPVIEIVKEN